MLIQLSVLLVIAGSLSFYFNSYAETNFESQTHNANNQEPATDHGSQNKVTVKIVKGAANKNNEQFFVPQQIQLNSGGTVTWQNNDKAAHTATADNGEFDSGIIAPSKIFSTTLDKAETLNYKCTIHPWMTGTITVK